MKVHLLHTLRNLHKDESGQDLIEYALVAALIAFAAAGSMNTLASHINAAFSNVGTEIATKTT